MIRNRLVFLLPCLPLARRFAGLLKEVYLLKRDVVCKTWFIPWALLEEA